MLVKCTECQKEISEKASSCPHCGNPMMYEHSEYVTTQQTGKSIKFQQLLAILLILCGIVGAMVAVTDTGRVIAGIMFSGGLVWYFIARIMQWWQHQ